MTLQIRMRWLAAWLGVAVALALPLGAFAQDDDEAQGDEEQSEQADADDESDAKADDEEADDDEDGDAADWTTTHRGLYLLAEGSYSFLTRKGDLEDTAEDAGDFSVDVNSKTDDTWGYGGRLGWRLAERIAVEGQFALLNDIQIKQHVESGNDEEAKAQFLTATANVKGYLLTQRIQPYGLLGAGYGYSEIDPHAGTDDRSHGFAMRFGAGADFYVTDGLGLMGEVAYVLPTGDISDFEHVALHFGAFLRFYGAD